MQLPNVELQYVLPSGYKDIGIGELMPQPLYTGQALSIQMYSSLCRLNRQMHSPQVDTDCAGVPLCPASRHKHQHQLTSQPDTAGTAEDFIGRRFIGWWKKKGIYRRNGRSNPSGRQGLQQVFLTMLM